MNYLSPDALAKAIVDEMRQSGHTMWIDPETHAEQHQFIAEMIKERHERTARRKRIEEMIAGSLLLSTIVVVVGLVGAGVLEWLRTRLRQG